MSEWQFGTLGHACNISTGFAFKGDKYEPSGNLRVVRGENVTVGKLRWDSEKHWNHFQKGLKDYLLEENDIVIGMDGSRVGQNRAKIQANELPLILAQRVARLRAKDGFDQNFIWYQILDDRFKEYVEAIHTGTSIPHISMTQIGDFEITVPPLPEQKAIAAVLSSLDDKIELLHRQNKTLEAMAETLFRQWFVQEIQWDWEETNLEKHTDAYRGLSYKGSGLCDVGLGLPMHNLNSVFEGGGYKEAGIKYYSGEVKKRHFLKAGDIIIANTEQGHEFKLIGFPAIVPTHFGDRGLFSQHIYRLVSKPDSYLTLEYLYYLLMTPFIREQITSATNGSTVNMLAIDGLQRPEFKLPPKEKVVEFTVICKAWWRKKEVNHSQIRTLEKLRNALLPKLMSGEVRIQL
ncbi:restriction endonuclease subunit S [bacterium]|nr:restriction endonuclease subunit S [bacterium]